MRNIEVFRSSVICVFPALFLSLLTLAMTACNSESSTQTMQPMQLSTPDRIRTAQALQYSQIYAEISINNGAPQRFDFTSDNTLAVNVTGVVLGVQNNIAINWYENFLGEPLLLATQSGSFDADTESRTAVIDLDYNYDHNDDGDTTNNITERAMGQCPWVDSRCADDTQTPTITPPTMIDIPGGTFTMGSDAPEAYDNEKPPHQVTIAPFKLAETEVTWREWNICMANNGCGSVTTEPDWLPQIAPATRDLHPVGGVSWQQTQDYIAWLNTVLPGNNYRLPTEAEFEYALRANTTSAYFYGDEYSQYCDYANGSDRACLDGYQYSAPVKSFLPNPFGLYDMNGNIDEWTQDCKHESYVGAPTNGEAWLGTPEECGEGVLRGGNHNFVPGDFRITVRRLKTRYPDFVQEFEGFRLASD